MVLNPRASLGELTHAFSSAEAEREGGLNQYHLPPSAPIPEPLPEVDPAL
jgi:hypothetical protein